MKCFTRGKPNVIAFLFIFILLSVVVLLCVVQHNHINEGNVDSSVSIKTTVESENKTTFIASTTLKNVNDDSEKYVYTDSSVFPDEIKHLLENNKGYSDVLIKNNCQQLIVVNTESGKASVGYYSFDNGCWNKNDDLSCSAFIGKNGSTSKKTEGDGCTPLGVYKINSAFYIHEKPQTKLDLFKITEDSYWVDDVDSVFYNQYVTDSDKKDWNSAEHMIEYNGYRYGFVVAYNPTCEPGLGSAIFFHVGYNPTAGCIAINEEMILKYLSVLDKEKNPFVLIA